MSRRRSKRHLSEEDKQTFLVKAGELRTACVGMQTRGPINDPLYDAISELMRAIDGVAEVVTGQRDHFHAVRHSATPHMMGGAGSQATAAGAPVSFEIGGAEGVGRFGGE